jgi:hypothetical protein
MFEPMKSARNTTAKTEIQELIVKSNVALMPFIVVVLDLIFIFI